MFQFHSILFVFSVWICSLSMTAEQILNSCDVFHHRRYGLGRCIEKENCKNGLYLSGLCEAYPSTVQCCFSQNNSTTEEFRAVWIATVENIDWPSTNTISPEQQQSELLDILNLVQKLNMNVVIFQVNFEYSFSCYLSI